MTLARVVGSVVADSRADGVPGALWRLVQICDHHGRADGDILVALDQVNAGEGDVVLLCRGSSVRWTAQTADKPVDVLIAAVADLIDEDGVLTYRR